LSKGLLINGFYDLNYYHWLIDIIPQLQYIDELPEEYADFPILISEMADKIRSIKELLSLFNIKRKIIYLRSTQVFVVDNLLLISSPNRYCPRIIGAARSAADCSYIRRESIYFLRDLVLNNRVNCKQSFPKKVFLAPSMKHRQYNQDEVFDRLQQYGFVKINPENMGLIEQASIFNNADLIVGPTGATWTNLVFAKGGSRALCWMAEEWGDFSVFSNLADAVNVGLQYLTYRAGVESSNELFSKGYKIDIFDIEKWVETQTMR
jgi:capsular polysaccharide biosynthesis protein